MMRNKPTISLAAHLRAPWRLPRDFDCDRH